MWNTDDLFNKNIGKDMIRAAKIKLICSTYLPVINTDNKLNFLEEGLENYSDTDRRINI